MAAEPPLRGKLRTEATIFSMAPLILEVFYQCLQTLLRDYIIKGFYAQIAPCSAHGQNYRGKPRLFCWVSLCRPRPIRIRDERERLLTASPVMTEFQGPGLRRNNYPENGLVNSPRRDTRDLSPASMFEGKAPSRLAAHKSRPHAHLGPMCGAPAYFLSNGEYELD